MGLTVDQIRYSRLCFLVLRVCATTLRGLIDYCVTHAAAPDFETFLNNKLHSSFHLRRRKCCCGNTSNDIPITVQQWDLLFLKNSNSNPHRKGGECPCQFKAHAGIQTSQCDVTMCCLILNNACQNIPNTEVELIRTVRNELVHATDASVDELSFKRTWSCVENALKTVASTVSKPFLDAVENDINNLGDRIIDPEELETLRTMMADHRNYDSLNEVK